MTDLPFVSRRAVKLLLHVSCLHAACILLTCCMQAAKLLQLSEADLALALEQGERA
jgi:hypothetical protein